MMKTNDLIGAVTKEFSGYQAKEYSKMISSFHRIQVSPGLSKAQDYVASILKEMGFEVNVYSYPGDGKTRYLDGYVAPIGWEVRDGFLEVRKPRNMVLGRFKDHPTLVVAHSGSLPEGVEGELVYVGEGVWEEDYKNIDVEGKFVIAKGPASIVFKRAVIERDAIGIIVFKENTSNPDGYPYAAIWPTAETLYDKGLAFSVSYNVALRLLRMLEREQVMVYGRVDARFYEGEIKLVEGRIQGKYNKDVLLVAHICHPSPGANDNSSGSGTLIEVARAAMKLVENGFRLDRGLRFWWVPEFTGIIAHLDRKPEVVNELVSVINLDMVGGHQDKVGGVLTVVGSPEFNPSFLPFLAYGMLEKTVIGFRHFGGWENLPKIRYKLTGYSGGSDHHIFVDPWVNVAATAFIEWPDKFYHSDRDTLDNLDPDLMRIVGSTALSTAFLLTSTSKKTLQDVIIISYSNMKKHLYDKLQYLVNEPYWYVKGRIKQLANMYLKALSSIERTWESEGINEVIKNISSNITQDVENLFDILLESGEEETPPRIDDKRVFKRLRRSPLHIRFIQLESVDKELARKFLRKRGRGLNTVMNYIYFMCDGKKTLEEIFDELKYVFKGLSKEDFQLAVEVMEKTAWIKEQQLSSNYPIEQ
ncbi:MAG: DUF4910 domain-containing protein [Thermoproteales archaeon]|nr:DUF4910 domain-containing protein [Thermoproteales archaeon]